MHNHMKPLRYSNSELYYKLMDLVRNSEKKEFTYVDQKLDDKTYRIFTYRLASWTTFQDNPVALECRGSMFDITDEDDVILVCRPQQKFFNVSEGGVEHNPHNLFYVYEKIDGSLMSTFIHNGELRLKSKGSIKSMHCIKAMEWLDKAENESLKRSLTHLTNNNNTVNLEWIGPDNRIVVGYDNNELVYLNNRNIYTGVVSWPMPGMLYNKINHAREFPHLWSELWDDFDKASEKLYNETFGEGYVLVFGNPMDNYCIKLKNHKYCNIHRIRDSIVYPESLCELVIKGETDDLYDIFKEDEKSLQIIKDMEDKIIPEYNTFISEIESFHQENSHLSRKDYAIKGTKELPKSQFVCAMNMYIGREFSFVDYTIKNMRVIFNVKNPSEKEYV